MEDPDLDWTATQNNLSTE